MTHLTRPTSLSVVLNHPDDLARLPWAAAFARRSRLPLTLMHVVDPLTSREHPDNAEILAQDMLSLAASSALLKGLDVQTHLLAGSSEVVLPEYATANPNSVLMLVGGEHGTFARSLLGRGMDNVIRKLTSPILYLPPGLGGELAMERVVIGFDRSEISRSIVELARSLAASESLQVTVVEVFEPGDVKADVFTAISPTFEPDRIVMRGRPGPSLLAAARVRDVGLIAVGSHGWGRASGVHLGSTARWLSQHADRPLLIVPAAGSQASP